MKRTLQIASILLVILSFSHVVEGDCGFCIPIGEPDVALNFQSPLTCDPSGHGIWGLLGTGPLVLPDDEPGKFSSGNTWGSDDSFPRHPPSISWTDDSLPRQPSGSWSDDSLPRQPSGSWSDNSFPGQNPDDAVIRGGRGDDQLDGGPGVFRVLNGLGVVGGDRLDGGPEGELRGGSENDTLDGPVPDFVRVLDGEGGDDQLDGGLGGGLRDAPDAPDLGKLGGGAGGNQNPGANQPQLKEPKPENFPPDADLTDMVLAWMAGLGPKKGGTPPGGTTPDGTTPRRTKPRPRKRRPSKPGATRPGGTTPGGDTTKPPWGSPEHIRSEIERKTKKMNDARRAGNAAEAAKQEGEMKVLKGLLDVLTGVNQTDGGNAATPPNQ